MAKLLRLVVTIIVVITLHQTAVSQSLSVNTDGSTAHSSAILDVKSSTKGMLIPRLSKVEKNAIPSPATGLMIYQNNPDSIGYHYYNGSSWIWLANAMANNAWLLNGNIGTNPSVNFIGTDDFSDLVFKTSGVENIRLKTSALTGLYEPNPRYTLDVSMGAGATFPCARNGLRLKNAGMSNACDNGFFLGYNDNNLVNDASIWNYGSNGTGAQNLLFGFNTTERMRFTTNGFIGLGETAPQYSMDVKIGAAAVNPCTRNGLRLNIPAQTNNCDNGLFVGYDNNNSIEDASFWNFGNGSPTPPATRKMRFGFSNDFINGEVMRIMPNGIGVGATSLLAKIHILDKTAVGLPGVMVSSSALPNAPGFYTGLNLLSNARVWNYQNAFIEIGTDNTQRIIVLGNGNVGIGNSSPTQKLHVEGNICYTGSIAACSDIRYKKDIALIQNPLQKLIQLEGVTYNWKTNEFPSKNFSNEKQVGFIAQDLEKLFPEMVFTDGAGYKSIDYSRLAPVLVETIKEQQKQIDAITKMITELQKININR